VKVVEKQIKVYFPDVYVNTRFYVERMDSTLSTGGGQPCFGAIKGGLSA
jgi:hypothetical protein